MRKNVKKTISDEFSSQSEHQTKTDSALHYCERIKNQAERFYARDFRVFLLGYAAKAPQVPKALEAEIVERIRVHLRFLVGYERIQ